jgi:methyl-accepting chemotaxis protein
MALPVRMFALANLSWWLAGVSVPLCMSLRLGGLGRFFGFVIGAAAVTGGFVSSLLVFFVVKRLTAGLRDAWAARIGDPEERAALVLRIPLAAKLGVGTCAIVVVTVFFTVLLAYTESARPVERYATSVQQRLLQHELAGLARAEDPAPALEETRALLRDLGVAGEILIVSRRDAAVLDGPAEALDAAELRLVARAEGGGDSGAIDSDHVFAWVPLDADRAVVAVLPRGVLAHGLSPARARFAGLFVFVMVVALGGSWLLSADVSRAIESLRSQADRIASGDLRSSQVRESEDETGDLARSFAGMARSLRTTVGHLAEAARRADSAAAEMTAVSRSVESATRDQVQGIEEATTSMASINHQVSGITESAQVLNGNVEEASSSILELGAAGDELNLTASSLSGRIDEVGDSIEQTVRSVRRIAEHTDGLAAEVGETSASISEMASSMHEVDSNAREMALLSQRVVELSEGGRERVQQTIEGMDEIRASTDGVAKVIHGLGTRVQEIGAILNVIDDVADETNLLALNAAIIAAQAGEHGRAFSVVADEIKDLADRVLSSTKEIAGLIRAVQGESQNAASAMRRGTESVQGGVELAAQAGHSLEEITGAARMSGERIQEIVVAVREQARASGHVASLIEHVSERVEQIRAAGREQERGNEVVVRGTSAMRDVAQQTRRTTEEQSRGARRIRESIESVRDAVDRIHGSLQEQSQACRAAVSFLEKVHARTRSNEDAAARMTRATAALKQQAEALREDVRRFTL